MENGKYIEGCKMGWIEDMDLPDCEMRKGKNRGYVECFALHEYKKDARRVQDIPMKERHREAVKLMGMLGMDVINFREVEYIHRRINSLRGLRADGRPKTGVEGRAVAREIKRRHDPVWRVVRKINGIVKGDKKRVKLRRVK